MPASSNAYGQINPQIVDPYPIETSLAQMSADPMKQSVASPLLALYRSDRNLQGSLAANEMERQHGFAREKLQAEIAKNSAEALINAAKAPGGLSLIGGMQGGYGSQVDPNIMRAAIERQDMADTADRVKKVLEGAYSGVQAGYELPTAAASGMAGTNLDRTTPLATRNALIAANARIAAAQAGAGQYNVTIAGQTAKGDPTSVRIRTNEANAGPAAVGAQNVIDTVREATAPKVTTSGGTVPQSDQSQVPPDVTAKASQAMRNIESTNPTAYRDILSGSAGRSPRVQKDTNGNWNFLGKSGNLYPIR